jgi:SP family sugar:H+ symporter-like MFS transporter
MHYGTFKAYTNSAQCRTPNGLSVLWVLLLGTTMLFLPESPRYSYRKGVIEDSRKTMAKLNGVKPHSTYLDGEIAEI